MERIKAHYKIILIIIATIVGLAIFIYLFLNNLATGSVFYPGYIKTIPEISDKNPTGQDNYGQIAGDYEEKESVEDLDQELKPEKSIKKNILKTQQNLESSNNVDALDNEDSPKENSPAEPSPTYSFPTTPPQSPIPLPSVLD